MTANEQERQRIVDRIQKPIQQLDPVDAELLMLHAAFEVSTTVGLSCGRNLQQQRQYMLACFESFLDSNLHIRHALMSKGTN